MASVLVVFFITGSIKYYTMELVLPSAANWYCSRIVDCSRNGVAVIGAKNSIDIWDIRSNPVCHIGNISAHHERIVGISLCGLDCNTDTDNRLPRCCTAGEDGYVRIWNLNSRELLHEHCHHKVILYRDVPNCG